MSSISDTIDFITIIVGIILNILVFLKKEYIDISLDKAIKNITSGYKEKGDIRKLTEIDSIPDKLTFKEFNQFVNEFDNIKIKTI